MDLEQIPEITEIARYIENMEFRKKALGGIDEKRVRWSISVSSVINTSRSSGALPKRKNT